MVGAFLLLKHYAFTRKDRRMKKAIAIFSATLALTFAASPAAAAPSAQWAQASAQFRVATFVVPNMTCPTCPITVKKAMSAVHGVRSVKIDLGSKMATVQFDPKLTNAAVIAAASTNAGYPAKLNG